MAATAKIGYTPRLRRIGGACPEIMRKHAPIGWWTAISIGVAGCVSGNSGAGGAAAQTLDTQPFEIASETGPQGDSTPLGDSTLLDGAVAAGEVDSAQAAADANTADSNTTEGQSTVDVAAAEVTKPLPNTSGEYKKPGNFAPDFLKVVNSTGKAVSKSELPGHWTVIWFYPAAMTSG